jgi:hypothetical protein
MSRFAVTVVALAILAGASYAEQAEVHKGLYMGQKPPGRTPEVFAPGFVSTDEHEFAPSFSPDGKEFYFSRGVGQYRRKSVMVARLVNGVWAEPERAITFDDENFEARVAPDGERIFFMGFHAVPDKERPDIDVFFAGRTEDGWGEPEHLGPPFNPAGSMYISFTEDGTIYTTDAEGGNIARSRLVDGEYSEFELLEAPVNTEDAQQVYPFVSPDGSYLIFNEMGGVRGGESGLMVTFRYEDGSWSVPREIPLGMRAGTASVSPDGKYLFFTARRPKGDIYWVDARVFKDFFPKAK